MHPRSKIWHFIGYIIVRTKDCRDVLNTRVMTSAEDYWTKNCLIFSIISICLMRKRWVQKRQCRPKLNIDWLGDTTFQQQLQTVFRANLPKEYPMDIEAHWDMLKSNIIDCCKSTLGHKPCKHQDWYDENDIEIQQLIDIKRQSFITCKMTSTARLKEQPMPKQRQTFNYRENHRELKNPW